jgi:hypothetical protein
VLNSWNLSLCLQVKLAVETRCSALEESVARVEGGIVAATEEAHATRAAVAQGDVKLKALHALQKLMARPDAAEVFKKFDTDGDGALTSKRPRSRSAFSNCWSFSLCT